MNTDLTHSAIVSLIHTVRGQRVILDSDLARLYNVPTKRINEQTRRNPERFLGDFAFRLSAAEANNLRSQFATSSWGGRRYLPFAFTEQGIAMLSGILRSKRAVLMNIAIMRAFVKLRQILSSHKELAQKFNELEKRIQKHDVEIYSIFKAIRNLMADPEKSKKKIGFLRD